MHAPLPKNNTVLRAPAGSKLYVYQAGTRTPAPVWADIEHERIYRDCPIVFGPDQRAAIFADDAFTYRFVLRSKVGKLIYDVEVPGAQLAEREDELNGTRQITIR